MILDTYLLVMNWDTNASDESIQRKPWWFRSRPPLFHIMWSSYIFSFQHIPTGFIDQYLCYWEGALQLVVQPQVLLVSPFLMDPSHHASDLTWQSGTNFNIKTTPHLVALCDLAYQPTSACDVISMNESCAAFPFYVVSFSCNFLTKFKSETSKSSFLRNMYHWNLFNQIYCLTGILDRDIGGGIKKGSECRTTWWFQDALKNKNSEYMSLWGFGK